jgi:glutamine synthetase
MKKPILSLALLISFNVLCTEKKAYQETIELEEVAFINYLFTDIHGHAKEVTYPAATVESVVKNGFNFDGSSIPGMTSISESDMVAYPDMQTLALLPWSDYEQKTARVICDVYEDEHTPYAGDPRYVLKQAIAEARTMGFDFFVGPELEFFLCDKNFDNTSLTPSDNQGYFDDTRNPSMSNFKTSLFTALLSQKVTIEKIHHEVGPGQYEMSFKYNDALTIADHLIITKQTMQALCQLNNLKVTFMPKPFHGQNGNGMHIHFSLWDRTENCNAFYDKDDPAKLSPTAKHFIAGVLAHITELNALFNSTVNSYKRLVPGFEAPINLCWGTKNRSAMIRIPRVNDDQHYAVRAELRSADPMANPYLAFAALLRAGLDGIKHDLPLAAPIEDNLYHISAEERMKRNIKALPHSLEHAITLLQQSALAKEILGECLLTEFVKNKQQEIAQYNTFITDWEIQTYFEG